MLKILGNTNELVPKQIRVKEEIIYKNMNQGNHENAAMGLDGASSDFEYSCSSQKWCDFR